MAGGEKLAEPGRVDGGGGARRLGERAHPLFLVVAGTVGPAAEQEWLVVGSRRRAARVADSVVHVQVLVQVGDAGGGGAEEVVDGDRGRDHAGVAGRGGEEEHPDARARPPGAERRARGVLAGEEGPGRLGQVEPPRGGGGGGRPDQTAGRQIHMLGVPLPPVVRVREQRPHPAALVAVVDERAAVGAGVRHLRQLRLHGDGHEHLGPDHLANKATTLVFIFLHTKTRAIQAD